MSKDNLDKFEFLIGDWILESIIPKSVFSDPGTDTGVGSFKKILKDKYILFEYSGNSGGEAKGIFAWDEKIKMFRYWWNENSGNFSAATCNFINDKTLAMNWHDALFVQTFTKETSDRVVLKMQHPADRGGYELVLEVIFTKR
ncbi:MAG: hypothetical protein AMS27_03040 [Bacteroides sp. SM23_62_1]|nr:MAG: hypothetical protein AMS27_03040 [Bacteroides sp. SM23_62_1]